MHKLTGLSLFLLSCVVVQPSYAHDTKLIYCNDIAGTELSENNTLSHQTSTVGKLPGPAEHFGMHRTDLDTLRIKGVVGFENNFMRGRFWRMSPGGVIADHCHEDRPAMVYLLQGKVEETKRNQNGGVDVNILTAGDNIAEGNGTRHWWINKGTEDVTMFAVDFPRKLKLKKKKLKSFPLPRVYSQDGKVQHYTFTQKTELLDLGFEYPLRPNLDNYIVQTRVTTVAPNGIVDFENSTGLPTISYVASGEFTEKRSDSEQAAKLGPEDHSALPFGVYNIWKNIGTETGQIITIEIKSKE